jgi:hypothetical protein
MTRHVQRMSAKAPSPSTTGDYISHPGLATDKLLPSEFVCTCGECASSTRKACGTRGATREPGGTRFPYRKKFTSEKKKQPSGVEQNSRAAIGDCTAHQELRSHDRRSLRSPTTRGWQEPTAPRMQSIQEPTAPRMQSIQEPTAPGPLRRQELRSPVGRTPKGCFSRPKVAGAHQEVVRANPATAHSR